MNNKLVNDFIVFIAEQLYYMSAPVTTIRIIKILYLTDIEYYKKHKRTLSTINWVRYKYGPYFFELPRILQSSSLGIQVDEILTEQGFTRAFKPTKKVKDSPSFDFSAEQIISTLITKWGNEDLGRFLDFVYRTPPMVTAEFGKPLDFSTLEMKNMTTQKIERHIQLESKDSLSIQNMLSERTSKINIRQFEFDKEYYDAIRILDSEDTKDIKISGLIKSKLALSEILENQYE